ncbi:MAG: MATE family efflux transporter [Clostridia bacterium]|jgi:putative MATE family efflux protein|nr:MATE family efflux transporter [Clostridia bacterium]MBT7123455.1 MATE family efflux transporter [Clostridia bacterium]
MKLSFGKKIDATSGNLTKILWKMAWPLIIINLIQVLYNFADTFWVGQLEDSANAIAAVSTSFSIIFVMVSLAIGLNIATATLVSMYFGAKDNKNLEASCFTAIILIGVLAVILAAVGLIFREQLLALINTPPEIYDYALEYYSIIMFGMFFAFMFYVLSGILRGVGDVVTPMIAGVASGLLNMVLDPFLIFGWGPFPEMGVSGAALATIIARALVFFYLVWYIFSGRHHIKLHIKDAKVHWHLAKKMVKIAIPASISQVFLTLSGFMLFARVNMFGAVASSAYSLGSRIDSLLFLPSISFSQATATIVGQNIGAEKKHRARKASILAIIQCGIISFVISTLLMFFPTAIFDLLFAKAGAPVLLLARDYVMIISFGYAFLSVRLIINGVFQGAGASMYLMFTTIASLALRVGLGYAFSYTALGIQGMFMGISISFVLSAIFMFIVFRKGKWLDVDVIKPRKTKKTQDIGERT